MSRATSPTRRALALVLLGAALSAPVAAAEPRPAKPAPPPGALAPPWDDESIPKAIRKVLDDQAAAWNRGDLKGFMAGYLRSPELTFLSGGDAKKGWEETFARYRARYKSKGAEMGRLTFSDIDVRLLRRNDLALVTGRWKLKRSKDEPDGLFTLLVWRTPEGWRIVHDHTSMGLPAPKKKAKAG
jgi:beta-aspartyl-peptidase (threonine type)